MENSIEYYPSLLSNKTAVTLVAHGLNLKPEAMLPLVKWLINKGSDVFLVKLPGHYNGGIDIREASISIWQEEMLEIYAKAKKASVDSCVPLYFLGYSLGALLGQSMLISNDNVQFDRQVLIAPAIAIRRRSYLLKLLFLLGMKFSLPSYTPKGYRVNNFLPLSVYKILFAEAKKVNKSRFSSLNISTLIIIDPKDELVSYKKLKRQVEVFNLNNCRMVIVNKNSKDGSERYHHLIIDEQTMGKSDWSTVTEEINKFFFNNR